MRKRTLLLLVLCCAGAAPGQYHVPEKLYHAVEDFLKDGYYLKAFLKGKQMDTTIQVSEIEVGVPVPIYHFKKADEEYVFQTASRDTPVMSLVEPTGRWEFSLKARGEYLFGIRFKETKTNWEFAGAGWGKDPWSEVRKAYPVSSGIHPIKVIHAHRQYLHFPQIGQHNLTRLCDSTFRAQCKERLRELEESGARTAELGEVERILSTVTDSYGILVDSRKAIGYLKSKYAIANDSMPSGEDDR
jgi:hypothetical protein